VNKEYSEHQGRFAHGNDDEGHTADVGDPGATEVPESTLKTLAPLMATPKTTTKPRWAPP
jgi:hypothetical protein